MPRESKTSERRLAAVDKQRKALELRRAGKSYPEIAAELKFAGPSGAYAAVMKALAAVTREPAKEVLALELERLDLMLAKVLPPATADTPDLKAVDRVLKLMERRAALLGLDAPKGIRLGNLDDTPFKVYAGFSPNDV